MNPENESLWQSPINKPKTTVWYSKTSIGDHTISDFMKTLSDKAKLSRIYTNHDIRVTGCSVLGRCNFSDKQIMSISWHKSVESLKIYKKVTRDEKFLMGYTFGFALKNPKCIPIQADGIVVDIPALPALPQKRSFNEDCDKKRKKKLPPASPYTPQESNITPHLALQAPVVSNIEKQITQPSKPMVEIPQEYDFDLLQLVADVQNEYMPIPDDPVNFPDNNE